MELKKIMAGVAMALVAGVSPLFADTGVSLPVVEILGENYYVYTSRKGDSLFGIAKEFGWDEETLRTLNSKAVSPLPKGLNIYYPAAPSYNLAVNDLKESPVILPDGHDPAAEEVQQTLYAIKPGDTLFSVARRRGTTVAEIMKLNPGVSEKNFRAGETIMLPAEGAGVISELRNIEETRLDSFDTYKVGRDESWTSVSRKTGIPVEELKDANPGVDRLKNKMVISIPRISKVEVEKEVVTEDPREQTSEGQREIYEEIHRIGDSMGEKMRVAILLDEPSGRRDTEYTRGFLTALRRMTDSGLSYDIRVVDGSCPSEQIIEELGDYKPALLFLTADKSIPAYVSEYATVSCTPTVNVFDVKSEEYKSNPYFLQLLTPSVEFNSEIAAYLHNRYNGYTLLIAGEEDPDDTLLSSLREVWSNVKIKKVSEDNLENYLLTDKSRILIYGCSTRKSEVSALFESLKSLKEKNPLATVEIVGRPNWIVYDESLGDTFGAAGLMIPSRFYYDSGDPDSKIFTSTYHTLFGSDPQKTFPGYAAMGYDTAMYFLPGLSRAEGDMNMLRPSHGMVQADFAPERKNNWSGMMNPVVYLVRFNPYGAPDKIKVDGK